MKKANIYPFTHPRPMDGSKRSNNIFSAEGHVAYQITRKEVYSMFDMPTTDGLGLVKSIRHCIFIF